jgi:hypothetical protein
MQQPSVQTKDFAMIPKSEVPRSTYSAPHMKKVTFNASDLVPFFCEEILPGDTWNVNARIFARTATPIVPIMDNMHLETAFFFIPNRLTWKNWVRFCGEQDNPADSISYTIPQIVSPAGGFAQNSIYDYFGLPCAGQTAGGNTISINALPLRAYNLTFNQWYRDENLVNSVNVSSAGVTSALASDGPDSSTLYTTLQRAKHHDYFTSVLPFLQKGTAVSMPLGTSAPVVSDGNSTVWYNPSQTRTGFLQWQNTLAAPVWSNASAGSGNTNFGVDGTATTGLRTNLAGATGPSVNALRLAVTTQQYMELDARGGTRYTEKNKVMFGVTSPDARLQRVEYLGGGHSMVNINPVEQQSASLVTGSTTPLGSLSAFGTTLGDHGFNQAFTEHGYVIGLVNVRADITYQQGIRKMWSRSTVLDFYWPPFANLGEQPVNNREIYSDGSASDANVFGYQERWAEYRYIPSTISGLFRSNHTSTLDVWHLAEKFAALPVLNSTFITDQTKAILVRAYAAAAQANNAQFLADMWINVTMARCIPTYSVPGLKRL